jgi:hypothetical protein
VREVRAVPGADLDHPAGETREQLVAALGLSPGVRLALNPEVSPGPPRWLV